MDGKKITIVVGIMAALTALLLATEIITAEPLFKTTINEEQNWKKLEGYGMEILAPYKVKCQWNNPKSDHALCEVPIIITNKNIVDVNLGSNKLDNIFKTNVKNIKYLISYDWHWVERDIVNWTCFDIVFDDTNNDTIAEEKCTYRIKWQAFENYEPLRTNEFDKLAKNATISIKMLFESPVFQKNNFNISLDTVLGRMILDPDIMVCTDITASGKYFITAPIVADVNYCINISSGGVILDGQHFPIIADSASRDYGLHIDKMDNITVYDLDMNGFDTYAVHSLMSDIVTFDNVNCIEPIDDGYYLGQGNDIIIKNSYVHASNPSSKDCGIFTTFVERLVIENTNISNSSYGINIDEPRKTVIKNVRLEYNGYFDLSTSCDYYRDLGLINVESANNKPILFINESGSAIYNWNNVSEIVVCKADNSIIENVTILNIGFKNNGIKISNSDNLIIRNSTIARTKNGIDVSSGASNNLTIYANNISYSNMQGIYLYASSTSDHTIYNNTFLFTSDDAIYLRYADNVQIYRNWMKLRGASNYYCVYLAAGADNATVYNNYCYVITGEWFRDYAGTSFFNTTKKLGYRIDGPDYGNYIGGNWYSNSSEDYREVCEDDDKDGFCDNALRCGTGCMDYLPLSDEYSGAPPGPSTCACESGLKLGNPVDCSENCVIGACSVGTDVTTYNSGTIRTNGSVTDISSTTPSSGCRIVIGEGLLWG